MPKGKFQIYLAGPIHGCNDAQIRLWRDSVKRKYGAQCEFLDPSENLLNREASPAEVVEADIRAIENADGLLVNMWRESIGAALGVVHAHRRGQPVVVSDPNHLQNRILTFYADAVTESPEWPSPSRISAASAPLVRRVSRSLAVENLTPRSGGRRSNVWMTSPRQMRGPF